MTDHDLEPRLGLRPRVSHPVAVLVIGAGGLSLSVAGCSDDCTGANWEGVEAVSLTESQARDALVISARLVEDDGDPIPHVIVQLFLYDSGGETANWSQQATDENGVYRLDLGGYLTTPIPSIIGDDILAAVSYKLKFQPVGDVDGTLYCTASAEAPLSITSG